MQLECEKYKEKIDSAHPVCRHPDDYCQFRTGCIIQFMEKENTREKKKSNAGEKIKPSGAFYAHTMIDLDFTKDPKGLLPAIVQDYVTGDVLMLAYINNESWQQTLKTGKAHYWSRSRNKIWLKGESSGHMQLIKDIFIDCDQDTVVFKVEQLGGAACHKGYRSCFFRRVAGDDLVVDEQPIFDPKKVYGK